MRYYRNIYVINMSIKKQIIIILIIVFVGIFSNPITAQNTNLRDAVDYAINNNLSIDKSSSQIQQQQALNSGAIGLFMPKVSISGGYTWFNGNPEINMEQVKPAIDDMVGKYGAVIATDLGFGSGTQEQIYTDIVNALDGLPAYNLEIDFNQFPNASVNAIQPLFTGGKIINTRNISASNLSLANINHKSSINIIIKDVITNYLTVLLLNGVVNYRIENINNINSHINHTKKLVSEGIVTKHFLLKSEVALSNAEILLDADKTQLAMARKALNNVMNINQDTITLTDSLYFKLNAVNIKELKAKAQTEQVLLQAVEEKINLANYNLNMEKSEMMPQVFAFASYSMFNNYMPLIMPPFVAGVQLQFNIFNGTTDYKKIKAAQYYNEEAIISKENIQQKIDFWVEQSYLAAEDAKNRYIKFDRTVELAKEHSHIVEKRFEEGIERSVDVVDAHLIYQDAQIGQLKILYEYYISLTNLYFAVGTPEEVIGLISN